MPTDLLASAYAAHVMTKEDEDKRKSKRKKIILTGPHAIKREYVNTRSTLGDSTRARIRSVPPVLTGDPVEAFCPDCDQRVVTETFDVYDKLTYFTSFSLAAMGLCLIAWVPFCLDRFQSVEHTCPKCHRSFGKYKEGASE